MKLNELNEVVKLIDGINLQYFGDYKKEALTLFDGWKPAPMKNGTTSNEIILVYPKKIGIETTAEQLEQYRA